MTAAADTGRSCLRCNDAKRKCDRNTPACRLCKRKDLACMYPRRKPSRFVPIMTLEGTPSRTDARILRSGLSQFEADQSTSEPLPDLTLGIADDTQLYPIIDPRAQWFAAPETFEVDHSFMRIPPNFKISDLEIIARRVDSWMRDWVTSGSNTFIHAHLYGDYFPPFLQVAFATFSAYIHRTPATSRLVLQAVNDQATALITEENDSGYLMKDLALLHALLAYQVIGLFDGDIRARHLAESRMSTLSSFADRILTRTSAILAQQLSEKESSLPNFFSGSSEQRMWHAWIISESVRRTWTIAQGVRSAYEGLKQGWAPCHGDLRLTTREGLWTADSARTWTRCLDGIDVYFTGRFHAESLFETAPEEIDEFAKFMLEVMFGKERCVEWEDRYAADI